MPDIAAEAKHGPETIDLAALRDFAADVRSRHIAQGDGADADAHTLALAVFELAEQIELLAAQRKAVLEWCAVDALEPWMLAAEIRKVYADAAKPVLLEHRDGSVHLIADLIERLRQHQTELLVFADGIPEKAAFRLSCEDFEEVSKVLRQAPHAGVATRRVYVTPWEVHKEPAELAREPDTSAATETSPGSEVAL